MPVPPNRNDRPQSQQPEPQNSGDLPRLGQATAQPPNQGGFPPLEDPDLSATIIDTRFRHHILAHGVNDPDVDKDQLSALSLDSALPTLAPQRHESAFFDLQPSQSFQLSGILTGIPVEEEEVEQPSTKMRALSGRAMMMGTIIITGSFLVSRVLGLVRTSLFAALFGGPTHIIDADAYTQAFFIPDTIFNLVAGGALSSAFIPIFTQYLVEKRDKKTAFYVANIALNTAIAGLALFAALGVIFAPKIVPLYVFNVSPQEINEIVLLTRIMLLQPIFLGASTVITGILQTRQRFLLPAIGTLLYNVGLILGLCATLLDNQTHIFGGHLGILGPTWGVVLGAALQFLVQVPGALVNGLRYQPAINFLHPGVKNIGRLMVPRIVNAGMLYLAFGVDRSLASLIGEGSAYGFFTAFQLMLLPLGIFGMAVSTAAFPTLATLFAAGQLERLRETIARTLKGILFLAIPASLGLIGLARPIIRLLLQHGNFTSQDTSLVYDPLIFLSIGIAGHAAVEILTRSFYALRDSRTPVYVSLCQFAFLIGMSILLFPLGLRGLGLAMSIGVLGEALALFLLLRQRLQGFPLQPLVIFLFSVLAASLGATLAALMGYALVDQAISIGGFEGTNSVTVNLLVATRIGAGMLAAGVVYLVFARLLGIDDSVPMLTRITRRFGRKKQ